MKLKLLKSLLILILSLFLMNGCGKKESEVKSIQKDSTKQQKKVAIDSTKNKIFEIEKKYKFNQSDYKSIQRKQIGDYKIRVLVPKNDSNYFHEYIFVKIKKGNYNKIINNDDLECGMAIEIDSLSGFDINGDGNPNLILKSYSGGAHCCYYYFIYELGDSVRLINIIPGRDSEIKFKDVNNDGIYEIKMRDWSYNYWLYSFIETPCPEVILSYSNGKYNVDTSLMKKPLPSKAILKKWISKVNKATKGFYNTIDSPFENDKNPIKLSSLVLSYFFDLVYQGHELEAKEFIKACWPKGDKRCKQFTYFLMKEYNKSLPKIGLVNYYKKYRN